MFIAEKRSSREGRCKVWKRGWSGRWSEILQKARWKGLRTYVEIGFRYPKDSSSAKPTRGKNGIIMGKFVGREVEC